MNPDKYGKKHSGMVGQNASQSASSQGLSYDSVQSFSSQGKSTIEERRVKVKGKLQKKIADVN